MGGGSLRDVFSGRTPKVFERGEPYALVAVLVSVVFLALDRATGNTPLATAVGVLTVFTIRALAVRYRWRTKAARSGTAVSGELPSRTSFEPFDTSAQ